MAQPKTDTDDDVGLYDVADEAADEASTLRGLADYAAGRFVSHEAVMRWVASWGTENPLPKPKCGE